MLSVPSLQWARQVGPALNDWQGTVGPLFPTSHRLATSIYEASLHCYLLRKEGKRDRGAMEEQQDVLGWAARDTSGVLFPFTFPKRYQPSLNYFPDA